MKKDDVKAGLLTLFAAAALGGIMADAGGFFNMQKFDLTVAEKHNEAARSLTKWPSVEDVNGRVYPVQGGGMYALPDGRLTWDDTTSLLGKIEEGQTYCAIKGEPLFMRKRGSGNLIGIYAKGPCPQPR